MKPLMIAHRGDTVNFPENTIDAFKSAFEKGADGIELDIHLNKKGEITVVHNYSDVDNPNNPLLEDVLRLFGQKGRLEIEIKSLDLECIKKLKELIDKYNPKDIEFTSSVYALLPHIKREFPNTKIGIIHVHKLFEDWMTTDFKNDFIIKYMKLCGANVLHMPFDIYTKDIVDLVHENNFLAHSHLKKGEDILGQYKRVIDLGVDQLTFDDITLLERV